tara:strand:- start:280 stop:693 length:414 start_codon:yes stop_codon:yes gene_type:complete
LKDKISDKDKKAWKNFISGNEKLHDKDAGVKEKKPLRTLRVDFHGYTLHKANEIIETLINDSYEEGISKIICVTGKGLHSNVDGDPYISKDLSILRFSVPEFIKKNNELSGKIREIKEAEIKDGGSGAFYIFLKKKL